MTITAGGFFEKGRAPRWGGGAGSTSEGVAAKISGPPAGACAAPAFPESRIARLHIDRGIPYRSLATLV
jgi:hypothetical protein